MPPVEAPTPVPADMASADSKPDPELVALPAPPRQERLFTVVLMLLTMLGSGALAFALRGEVAYALSPGAPLELGDLAQANPAPAQKNRYVRATGLLSGARTIRYERPMEGDSFRLAPIAGNPSVWVEIRVPEGMEGPKFTPPTSFVGRLVPFHEAGIRHFGLIGSAEGSGVGKVPEQAWLLVDGTSPRASRWAIALVLLLGYFVTYNALGCFKLLRRVRDALLRSRSLFVCRAQGALSCMPLQSQHEAMARILLVDADWPLLRTMRGALSRFGHESAAVDSVTAAGDLLAKGGFDICIHELTLPDGDGLRLLSDGRKQPGAPAFIVLTSRDDMRTTVEVVQNGAADLLTKPLDFERLGKAIEAALEQRRSPAHDSVVPSDATPGSPDLLGKSDAMRAVFKAIGAVSTTRATVLVRGESGTGKELVARAVHQLSPSANKPFVAFNCSAFAHDLIETELFGHARGAFTGALNDRAGRFELAGSGTLFLDEVGELPLNLQVKLLRVLQERSYERVGDPRPKPLEARIIAATHRDLARMVRQGAFREDLFYRLKVVEIMVPPLRHRMEDLPLLVEGLVPRINRTLGTQVRGVHAEAMRKLRSHRWPGNVRELENTLIAAAVQAKDDLIGPAHLPPLDEPKPDSVRLPPMSPLSSLREVERDHIAKVLAHTGWNKRRACVILKITRPTLDRKIKEFALAKPGERS